MSEKNKKMFSRIASYYDKMNSILSLGADAKWRAEAARECMLSRRPIMVLDVATGTGELALAINAEASKRGKRVIIDGIDFNEDMLEVARKKLHQKAIKNIRLQLVDALSYSSDNAFDVITSGFALRNFDSLEKFIGVTYKLLKSNGKVVFLEVAKPESKFIDFFRFYYFKVIPVIAARYNKDAYIHLVSTAWEFDKDRLIRMMKSTGFTNVKVKNLSWGAAFILTAWKRGKKASK